MKGNYILGAGVSGLIAKYYLPDYQLVCKQSAFGGQVTKSYWPLGPKVLHSHPMTEDFLKAIGMKTELSRVQIRYFYDGKIYPDIPVKLKNAFVNKKTNHFRFNVYTETDVADSTLSVKENYLDYYDIDFNILIKQTLKHLDVDDFVDDDVILVSAKNKIFTTSSYKQFEYNNVISTIPANSFQNILYDYQMPNKFHYIPITFALCDKLPVQIRDFDHKEWDWLYVADNRLPATRITKFDKKFVYEITGDFSKLKLMQILDADVNVLDSVIQRVGIVHTDEVQDIDGISFLGRLAQWSHSIKTQQTVEKVLTIRDSKPIKDGVLC